MGHDGGQGGGIRDRRRRSWISADLSRDYFDAVLDIVAESGVQVIEPPRAVFEVSDYEDNLILDLVVPTDSLILVNDDTVLTQLRPCDPEQQLLHDAGVDRESPA